MKRISRDAASWKFDSHEPIEAPKAETSHPILGTFVGNLDLPGNNPSIRWFSVTFATHALDLTCRRPDRPSRFGGNGAGRSPPPGRKRARNRVYPGMNADIIRTLAGPMKRERGGNQGCFSLNINGLDQGAKLPSFKSPDIIRTFSVAGPPEREKSPPNPASEKSGEPWRYWVSPGIVAGRYEFLTRKWSNFNGLIAKFESGRGSR